MISRSDAALSFARLTTLRCTSSCLMIDETDRLKLGAVEVVRDMYAKESVYRSHWFFGNRPQTEMCCLRTVASMFQLNFRHGAIDREWDDSFQCTQKWLELKLPLTEVDEVSKALMRIAHGNFWVLIRILPRFNVCGR